MGITTEDAGLDVLNFLRAHCQGKTLNYAALSSREGLHVCKYCVVLSSVAFDASPKNIAVNNAVVPLNTRGSVAHFLIFRLKQIALP